MDHGCVWQSLFQRVLDKAAVSKSKKSTAVRRNPKIRVPIFRQRPDARIRKAILFYIGFKPFSVIDGQTTVAAYPESSIVAWQNCHGNIANQAVSPCEHMHDAGLQVNQAVSIRAHPEPAFAVSLETT